MNKLASIISGTFLLAGVANAGDTIELTAAQMDDVTAGYISVYAGSYSGGSFAGHGGGVAGASESVTGATASAGYYGPSISTVGHNVTIGSAYYGGIYGSSHSESGISIGFGY